MIRAHSAGIALLLSTTPAYAGGLFLPGSGAISTSRAGAAVASADDGEALSLNPAGLAKTTGTTVTISAAIISYSMQFTRSGTYDNIATEDPSYEGQAYPTVKNQPKPPLGIGTFQPIPVIAVVSDLGTQKLRVAAGLYAPNAYPFRDMKNVNGVEYQFNGDFNAPPPPTRYDIMDQRAAVLLPSLAASYRITDQLDVGGRFSLGFAEVESTVALWGVPGNVEEFVKKDATINVDARHNFIPAFGLGVTYRPTPNIELGAVYNSQLSIHAKGDAISVQGPDVNLNGEPITIGPTADQFARCAKGGTMAAQKACVDFGLPMSATLGGRYKVLDGSGKLKGDIELNVGWENWGAVSDYDVVIDADIFVNGESALSLHDNAVRHEAQDTFNVRLGGSYHIPSGKENTIILRGGVGHDTAYAKDGWLRADIDGAARTMFALGGAYRTKRLQIDAGFGFIYEGSPTNEGTCNPVGPFDPNTLGCNGDGNQNPLEDRRGPDPINPLVDTDQQVESPVTLGKYDSHYIMFMLGASTWF